MSDQNLAAKDRRIAEPIAWRVNQAGDKTWQVCIDRPSGRFSIVKQGLPSEDAATLWIDKYAAPMRERDATIERMRDAMKTIRALTDDVGRCDPYTCSMCGYQHEDCKCCNACDQLRTDLAAANERAEKAEGALGQFRADTVNAFSAADDVIKRLSYAHEPGPIADGYYTAKAKCLNSTTLGVGWASPEQVKAKDAEIERLTAERDKAQAACAAKDLAVEKLYREAEERASLRLVAVGQDGLQQQFEEHRRRFAEALKAVKSAEGQPLLDRLAKAEEESTLWKGRHQEIFKASNSGKCHYCLGTGKLWYFGFGTCGNCNGTGIPTAEQTAARRLELLRPFADYARGLEAMPQREASGYLLLCRAAAAEVDAAEKGGEPLRFQDIESREQREAQEANDRMRVDQLLGVAPS